MGKEWGPLGVGGVSPKDSIEGTDSRLCTWPPTLCEARGGSRLDIFTGSREWPGWLVRTHAARLEALRRGGRTWVTLQEEAVCGRILVLHRMQSGSTQEAQHSQADRAQR